MNVVIVGRLQLVQEHVARDVLCADEENKLSDVIAGNQGAIVLMTTSRTKAEGEMNAETEIAQLNQRRAYMLPYQIINLLEQNSEVEDNRSNFQ